jgi:hypothetical protein
MDCHRAMSAEQKTFSRRFDVGVESNICGRRRCHRRRRRRQ